MTTITFKTPPFPHQQEEWDLARYLHARAVFWEQGLGKSKSAIDTAANLYAEGKIDAVLVVAPDGVHRNWVTEELPVHLPDELVGQTLAFHYRTDKHATKWHAKNCEELLKFTGLAWLAMSYDAAVTGPVYEVDPETRRRHKIWGGGKQFLWDFLRKRKVFYIVDEGRRIKNPKADRTKVIVKSGLYAPYKRLLNGTPVPNGPFDVYSQIQFLDPNFWPQNGFHTFTEFKTFFGIFRTAKIRTPGGAVREFQELLGYKNLDTLNRILQTIATRRTKEDCLKDLPPKLYTRRSFELTEAQRRVYDSLTSDFRAELEGGLTVSAALALTRMLRFQQVCSGFVPPDGGVEPAVDLGKTNPKLELLGEILEDMPHKAIVWCRFRRTLEKVMEMLGERAVRYDGTTSDDDRQAAVANFQRGEAQFFVANPQAAGEGLTLHAARTVIYVENSFDLAIRLQSEDRAHRIGQLFPVEYIDLVAKGSVEEYIVEALREKLDVSSQITGDRIRKWFA